MTREIIIQRTLAVLQKLPKEKANEIADFADYIMKKYEEEILQNGIQKLVSESKTFEYLQNEETLYTLSDVKEKYK
ncbi:MAG: hypothetical protein WCO28_13400 [Bacteroidota bacterium]|jgi:hypothetical protein